MKVIITESVAVAAAIARTLNVKSQSTAEGIFADAETAVIAVAQDFIIPNPIGVLSGKDALPIVPEKYTYGIRLSATANGRNGISEEDRNFADAIGLYLAKADEVIFASAGGVDAQARFFNLCRHFKIGTRTSRMWMTRLERKAIQRAFDGRRKGRSFFNLAQAGLVGMAMDEIFKYNVTEAYRALFPDMVAPIYPEDMILLSAAQSYLNTHQQAVDEHQPVTTHGVMLTGEVMGQTVKFYNGVAYTDKTECDKAWGELAVPAKAQSTYLRIENEVNATPALYTLSSLQYDAWAQCGLSFAKTRSAATWLYERGFISSPLTDNPRLPMSLKGYIVKRYPRAKDYVFAPDEKVPFNHGIIITGGKPFNLNKDTQKVYELIATRMCEALSAPTTSTELIVGIEVEGMEYYGSMPCESNMAAPIEPVQVTFTGKSKFTNSTKAPAAPQMDTLFGALATMRQLLTAQFNAGMPFSNAHDITDSIKRLCDNRFILNACGEPTITDRGKILLATFDMNYALSSLMADQVEAERIFTNRAKSKGGAKLISEFGQRIYDKTMQLISDNRLFPSSGETRVCPHCSRHSVVAYPRTLKCHVCGFSMPLQFMGHTFTEGELDSLLTHGYTSPIEFRNRRGHEFYESVVRTTTGIAIAPPKSKIY